MDNHPHEFVHDDHHVSQQSIREGYEVSDINIKLVIYTLIGLFTLLFVGGVMFSIVYLRFMESSVVPPVSDPQFAMMVEETSSEVDFPKLQQNPEKDKNVFIKAATEKLNSYGKIALEAEGGTGEQIVQVHIPIDRAIELVASGKAPYRQTPKIALEDGAGKTGDAASAGGI